MSIHSLIMRFSAVGGPSNLFPSFVLNNPGAYGEDDAGGTDSGKAYIYTLY